MTSSRFTRLLAAVTLTGASLVIGASGALAQSAPTSSAPASSAPTGSPPGSIPSCQFTSDNTHPLPYCSTGQTSSIPVASQQIVTYSFNYPGDNSNITFWASVDPINPTVASAIGVNVFDTTSKATPPPPVEIVTTLSNQANRDPHQMQWNYSSGTSGPVTLQFFNYSPNTVTFTMNDSGMVLNSGSTTTTSPLTLTLGSTPSANPAPGSSPAAIPAPPGGSAAPAPAPAQGANGDPSTITSCQFTSDNTHPLPFCSTGQTSNITVPAGGTVTYKFNYPGDNSNVTFFANVDQVNSIDASAIGVNVFDTTSKATPPPPVEVVTTLSNQANRDPHQMQWNYSSGTSGPVTLQFFNYSPNPVTFAFNDSGMVLSTGSSTTTTPMTLSLAA
ncbi:MAG TPA: hypothetical protein VK009_16435 [Chloroflexota bacterium]|nr:hypothetical protein [Chloroflexota bacterium]